MSQTKVKPSDVITTKTKQKKKPETQSEFITYTIHGKHNFLDEQGNPIFGFKKETHPNIFAVKECNGQDKFFIRINAEGKFYNPLDTSGRRELKDKRNIISVSSATFIYYINFLKTRNSTWLKLAQKEGLDN